MKLDYELLQRVIGGRLNIFQKFQNIISIAIDDINANRSIDVMR